MDGVRMRTRSQVSQEERDVVKAKKPKIHVEDLPILKYAGKNFYTTEFMECAEFCDDLLQEAQKSSDVFVLGFDLEWTFTFQTGPEKVALMQISPSLQKCYLCHVIEFKKLPASTIQLLAHPNVRLVGVNIKNDIRKLGRDFNINVDAMINNCIDCGVFANGILPVTQRWSMAKLVEYLMEKRINKDKKVRNSKWHVKPLSKEQITYAAIDAYASLDLYNILKKKEAEIQNENKDLTNEL